MFPVVPAIGTPALSHANAVPGPGVPVTVWAAQVSGSPILPGPVRVAEAIRAGSPTKTAPVAVAASSSALSVATPAGVADEN